MPNWCDNDLIIINYSLEYESEIAEVLDDLKDRVASKDEVIDANKIVPMPEEIKNTRTYGTLAINYFNAWYGHDANKITQEKLLLKYGKISKLIADEMKYLHDKYGCFDWYSWCLHNWGTKWGIVDSALMIDKPTELEYNFFSPWSEPSPVIDKLSEEYPMLQFIMDSYEAGTSSYVHIEWYEGERQVEQEEEYEGTRGG